MEKTEKKLEVPSAHRPLRLILREDTHGDICASLWPVNRDNGIQIAFAFAKKDFCYVHVDDECILWIGSTAFKIPAKKVDTITDFFGIKKVGQ